VPARDGGLQQKGGGRVRAQQIQLERLDLPREAVELAGQQHMPAGEPAHQPVRLRQRGRCTDIVED